MITFIETYMHHFDPESYQESMDWHHPGSQSPKEYRVSKTSQRMKLTVFSPGLQWDCPHWMHASWKDYNKCVVCHSPWEEQKFCHWDAAWQVDQVSPTSTKQCSTPIQQHCNGWCHQALCCHEMLIKNPTTLPTQQIWPSVIISYLQTLKNISEEDDFSPLKEWHHVLRHGFRDYHLNSTKGDKRSSGSVNFLQSEAESNVFIKPQMMRSTQVNTSIFMLCM